MLTPYIEDVARRLAIANFIAFAPDGLTSVGGYPGDDEKGAELFKQVDSTKMLEVIGSSVIARLVGNDITEHAASVWSGDV